jgi:hypothetical protein
VRGDFTLELADLRVSCTEALDRVQLVFQGSQDGPCPNQPPGGSVDLLPGRLSLIDPRAEARKLGASVPVELVEIEQAPKLRDTPVPFRGRLLDGGELLFPLCAAATCDGPR